MSVKKPSQTTVVVGMSGGVDSSVVALLLKKAGYNVLGIFMKNWEDLSPSQGGVCPSLLEYEDVIRVCQKIGIPHYSFNFVKEYQEQVFSHFLEEYKAGYTPNPDVLCNREIKFKVFFDKAKELGADFLAMGHYARILPEEFSLLKGSDLGKDQSYFLYTLKSEILKKVLFPIGHLQKKEVREIARREGLPTAEKKDSTGICFIGKRDFRPFLGTYLGFSPGNIETLEGGKIVGTHQGVSFYTMGQRKGLCIGGKGEAWFVVGKDTARNVLYVAQGECHPSLYCDTLEAVELSWVSETPPKTPFRCRAKIRYRQKDQDCVIETIEGDKAVVVFDSPQRAATCRQSIVFYLEDVCLGGGFIGSVGPSYYHQKKALPLSLEG